MVRYLTNYKAKLATEHSDAKYLRDAIGEVVLVLLGILIKVKSVIRQIRT